MYSSTISLISALDASGCGCLMPCKTHYPLCRRLGWPQGRSGRVRTISPPPRFDPWTFQPVAIRYNDWATPALKCNRTVCFYLCAQSSKRSVNRYSKIWAEPPTAAELDAHSQFSRLINKLTSQTNATFPFITTTMRFPFPSDDRSTGVPPPTVIHAVTGPKCLSASWETLLEKGQPTALRGHVRVMHLLGAFFAKSYHTPPYVRPSARPSTQVSQLEGRWTFSLKFFPEPYRYILVFI